MRKFWFINVSIATLLLVGFFLLIFFEINNLDVDFVYFKLLVIIICLTVIQFLFSLIYYIVKIRQHSLWVILALIYFLSIIFLEVKILFALMGGFLGDM